jgi:tetratricopeptide (TPR) repeat protein
MSDADWAATLDNKRQQVQPQYDTFENVAYNGVAAEQDSKKCVTLASEYDAAFPDGKFADQVHQVAITSLLQARDFAGVSKYGEAALAANPNNVSTLALLAYALAEDQSPRSPYITKSMEHARKAIELGKADSPDTPRAMRLSVGLAYSALGYCLMKQEKTAAAIPEFKTASELLKDEPGSREVVLFRMGYAYAKLKKPAEARELLNQVIAMKGPFEGEAKKVLTQMSAGAKQ